MAKWGSESIANKFSALIDNLELDLDTQTLISTHYKAITKQINVDFWDLHSDTQNSRYVGSYGRDTAIKKANNIDIDITVDIDIAVELPVTVLEKFKAYSGNGPEALLRAVGESLLKIHPHPIIGSEGRTLVLNYPGIEFEVFPVFLLEDQSYIYPHASHKGRWRTIKLLAEIEAIDEYDRRYHGKVRHLTKMMRAWKTENQVPISGLLLETLIMDFMESWTYRDQSFAYYGQMTKDFLKLMSQQDINQKHWLAKGSAQFVYRFGTFEHLAASSLEDAVWAMTYETEPSPLDSQANPYWRKIFGSFFNQS